MGQWASKTKGCQGSFPLENESRRELHTKFPLDCPADFIFVVGVNSGISGGQDRFSMELLPV